MKDLHPLINPQSNYYNEPGKKSGIEEFEDKYNVLELMSWAKITAHKYRLDGRKGKGESDKDILKEETYQAYYNMLLGLVLSCPSIKEMTAAKAYKHLQITWRYR